MAQRGFLTGGGNRAPDYVKNGNYAVNKDSPQARGLKMWVPAHRKDIRDHVGGKLLTVGSGTLLSPRGGVGRLVWQAPGSATLAVVEGSADGDLDPAVADPFSVSIWADIESGDDGTLISKAGNTAVNRQFQIWVDSASTKLKVHGSDVSFISDIHGAGPTLVSFTKSGAVEANDVGQYLNGLLDQTSTAGGNTTNNADVLIGARRATEGNTGSGFELGAGSAVWDARIYNVELTAAEIWHQFDPATRWDLYYELGRVLYFFPTAEAPAAGNPWYAYAQM